MNKYKTSLLLCLSFYSISLMAQPSWNCNILPGSTSHTIITPDSLDTFLNGDILQEGDYLGFFYENEDGVEKVAACLEWIDDTNNGVLVFGDDSSTEIKDGYALGDSIKMKVWKSATQTEHDLYVEFTLPNTFGIFPDAYNTYVPNGISIIDSIGYRNAGTTPVELKIFLEGPYDDGGMKKGPNFPIPLNHPYNAQPYDYTGTESLASIPNNMIDWVLLEARSGTPNTSGTVAGTTVIERKMGILLENGNVVDPLTFDKMYFQTLTAGESYYVAVRHRNHLDVLSSVPFVAGTTPFIHDFTNDVTKAFGPEQLKLNEDNYAVLYAGDYNSDGTIQVSDKDLWEMAPALNQVYEYTDGNLDGLVQVTDKDYWFNNKAKLGIVEIRY